MAFPGAPSIASSDARGNVGCVRALPGSHPERVAPNKKTDPAMYPACGAPSAKKEKKPEAERARADRDRRDDGGIQEKRPGTFPGAPSTVSSEHENIPRSRLQKHEKIVGKNYGDSPAGTATPGGPASPGGSPAFSKKKVTPEHEKKPPQELDVRAMLLDQFKKTIQKRAGSGGMSALSRSFRLADRDKSGKIDTEELVIALGRFGMKTDDRGAKMLLGAIDADGSGKIDQTEFLNAVRGPMNKRRLGLIDMAFKKIDKTGDGVVTIDDLTCYEPKHDPDVKAGKVTQDEALTNLLSNFDGNGDGTVTKKEFREYYKSVSSSIDNDDYFELMIRNAWHIPGGKGWCANTSNARVLVDFADGEQKVVCIDDDLGLDLHNRKQVIERLKKQGVKNIMDYHVSG